MEQNKQLKTKREIVRWLEENRIHKYVLNDDLSVDVNGDVDLSDKFLKAIPIQFNFVEGNFKINNNVLTSLQGCPSKVGGAFDCSDNKLTSLEYGPIEVKRIYNCSRNYITSLKFAPKKIEKSFMCNGNQLKSLRYAPEEVMGNFFCHDNLITSLKYAPLAIGLSINCENNPIKNLQGFNSIFTGHFVHSHTTAKIKEFKELYDNNNMLDLTKTTFSYALLNLKLNSQLSDEKVGKRHKL